MKMKVASLVSTAILAFSAVVSANGGDRQEVHLHEDQYFVKSDTVNVQDQGTIEINMHNQSGWSTHPRVVRYKVLHTDDQGDTSAVADGYVRLNESKSFQKKVGKGKYSLQLVCERQVYGCNATGTIEKK
ncbi:hypothetical protein J2Z48_001806 [Croceifilum oryzae]|uniref:Uncharacterized protein n=1 Tax=Croceifilum oryzae TaxID=1553429 RepID=A0AAJ1TEX8_9BACL|nr:hypothetical protein [Croceifilum oryzae]MDQ0417633.1 hypothetical protein [Croceifilum oryzae]